MVVTYSPQQQALVLLSVSIANIMSFNVDVGVVINDYHRHLKEEGAGYSSKSSTIVMWVVLAITAMAQQFAYITTENFNLK